MLFRIYAKTVKSWGAFCSFGRKGHFLVGAIVGETPQDFFDKLNEEFHFELDVCATAENAKCKKYYSSEEDGLKQEWKGVCRMNPPYGREIGNG